LKHPSIYATVVAIALLGCVPIAHAQGVYSVRGPWLDEQSHMFALESLRGSYTVITMAYGACRRVCSSSLKAVRELAALAAERHVELNMLVVGLDPVQDRPSDWAELRADQKLWFHNLEFLSGNESSTRAMAQSIGTKYWRYGEHTMHDFRIVLVSPEGRVVKSMDRFDQSVSALLP
jgi:cytochrome oxidase Cu insertion factor (SCO1/SenC/PrrC family)